MDSPVALVTIPAVWAPLAAVAALVVVLLVGWFSEKRQAARRETIRRLYQTGEQILADRSSADGLRRLETVLPELLGLDDLRVYLASRNSRSLAYVARTAADGAATPVLVPERVNFRLQNAELCLKNHSLLAVHDARRSPLYDESQAKETPRSMLFIPMSALDEPLGVLTVGDTQRARLFGDDERAVLQHLANQLAISIRLREQGSLRAQTTGGERLDVVCQLISAGVAEVEHWWSAVMDAKPAAGAAAALDRLRRFTQLHREEGHLSDAAAVTRTLIRNLAPAWHARGVHLHDATGDEPLVVAAPPGILELVLSSLLRHAEAHPASLGEKPFPVRALRLASTAQIDFPWPDAPGGGSGADPLNSLESPAPDLASLAVCRALVAAMGGQLRITADWERGSRLEAELPLAQRGLLDHADAQPSKARPDAPLTVLIVEPDTAACRTLVTALGEFGHRAVPAATAEEAIDLAKRVDFHVFFCSASPPGRPWQECYQDTRTRIPAFVLLTQGHDAALEAALARNNTLALALPLRRQDLAALLEPVESRAASEQR